MGAKKKNITFDIIFLDHDLGNRIYVDSGDPNTGFQVAMFIQNNKICYNEIIVHSMNYWGAKNIKDIIPDARLIPINIFNAEFIPNEKVKKAIAEKQDVEKLDRDDEEDDDE